MMRLKSCLVMLIMVSAMYAHPGQSMDRTPKNMDAVRIWKLTEVLELTEDQTVSFLPIVQIHERKLRETQRELNAIGKNAQSLLESEDLSQKEVDKILKEYMKKNAELMSIKEDFIKSLPKYLSPKQQVLYVGFEARFRQDLRDFMKDRNDRPGKSRR